MSTPPVMLKATRKLSRALYRRTEKAIVRKALRETGVSGAELIPTWTTKDELVALYNLARYCPEGAIALEIGSYLGASTCYIAAGLKSRNGRLICVDTWQNETMPEGQRDTFAEFERNVAGIRQRITTLRKRSDELTEADIPKCLHLVFIDGDHTYEAVKSDFECVKQFVSEEGIIAFHDCVAFQGVSRVIGEALESGEWMIIGHEGNLLWIKRAKWEI